MATNIAGRPGRCRLCRKARSASNICVVLRAVSILEAALVVCVGSERKRIEADDRQQAAGSPARWYAWGGPRREEAERSVRGGADRFLRPVIILCLTRVLLMM